jgi:hypothetical protein
VPEGAAGKPTRGAPPSGRDEATTSGPFPSRPRSVPERPLGVGACSSPSPSPNERRPRHEIMLTRIRRQTGDATPRMAAIAGSPAAGRPLATDAPQETRAWRSRSAPGA